jgi:hypothetical protein
MQGIRPDSKLNKIAYKILQTEKTLQQKNTYMPTEKQKKEWASTYTKSNIR